MDIVQYCRTEEIMGQVKWTTTNHTKGQSPSKKDDAVYVVGLGVLYYELLLENQTINSNKYHSWLDQLKAALDKKCVKLVNRKCIIFHQDNTRPHVSLMSRQKLLQLGWEVLNHPRIQWSLYLQISIYFGLYKILLMEKNLNFLEDCKRHMEQFFAQNE